MYRYLCSFLFFSFFFFFPFEVFRCTECKFVLVLRIFFFLRPNLEFWPVFTETPEIDWNYPKVFQSGIGTPWTKFLKSPLVIDQYNTCRTHPVSDWHDCIIIIIIIWFLVLNVQLTLVLHKTNLDNGLRYFACGENHDGKLFLGYKNLFSMDD